MMIDKFGQKSFRNDDDLLDHIMQSKRVNPGPYHINEPTDDLSLINKFLGYEAFIKYTESELSIAEFDKKNQDAWFMPDKYKNQDIAEYVLSLCDTQAELQRCGEELLLFQERSLFDLLRYLTFLVDIATENKIIMGVGRGSSVSSFVLYKLKVHRVDSLYYDLDIKEFLR